MIIFVCADWGDWVIYTAWGMWWADVIISCATTLMIPFIMYVGQALSQLILPPC